MKRGRRNSTTTYSPELLREFFARSDYLDYMVLRPLSHITLNWETTWDGESYKPEPLSFAGDLNEIIDQIASSTQPVRYHDNEDRIAERLVTELNWPIQKKGGLWIGADYQMILEQGAFRDTRQKDLIGAASGRVRAALDFGQSYFDQMDDGHMNMLAGLMTIAIYHRYCDGSSLMTDEAGGDEL